MRTVLADFVAHRGDEARGSTRDMLTCRDVTERATAFMERDPHVVGRLRFRLHLAMCAVCRRYVRQMRMTAQLVRRLGAGPLPPAPPDPALREASRVLRDVAPPH
ncbi:MAG: hypothetical protein AB1635_05465 [Acidobacteriota bacterium]